MSEMPFLYRFRRLVGSGRLGVVGRDATLTLIFAGVVLLRPAIAAESAQDLRRARELFEQAEREYAAGHFQQALSMFEAALRRARRPSIVLNIAQCHRQLGNADKALANYQLYLAEWKRFRPDREPPFKKEVLVHIERLSTQIDERGPPVVVQPTPTPLPTEDLDGLAEVEDESGVLFLDQVPAGAAVIVDGEWLTRSQGAPVRLVLVPGRHTVLVKASGMPPWRKVVRIEPGEQQRQLVLPNRPQPTNGTGWLIAGITTAALAVGSEAFAIAATLTANDSFRGSKRFDSWAALAITGHVLAGAFAITSGVSWWMWHRSRSSRQQAVDAGYALLPVEHGVLATAAARF